MIKIKYLIFLFSIIGVILFIMIFCFTGSKELSNKIADWQDFGQTLSSWIGLCLMVINILVIVLLNHSVMELNNKLSIRSIEAEKEKLKAQLRYENYIKFKQDWNDSYMKLQENALIDNQIFFDCFKDVFFQYVNNDSYLEANIYKLKTVIWWSEYLNYIDDSYRTNPDFDANDASKVMSPKIQELYIEIAKNIFEYT